VAHITGVTQWPTVTWNYESTSEEKQKDQKKKGVGNTILRPEEPLRQARIV
jgi:hypothetical protein